MKRIHKPKPLPPSKSGRRWRYRPDFGSMDKYLYFKRAYTKFKKLHLVNKGILPKDIPYNIFCAVNKENFDEYQRRILAGEKVRLPFVGSISIIKIKMRFGLRADEKKRRIPIDWKNTMKTGVLCYYLNEHRDYFMYKISWERNYAQSNISAYIFNAERSFKRKLSQILFHHPEIDYRERILPNQIKE